MRVYLFGEAGAAAWKSMPNIPFGKNDGEILRARIARAIYGDPCFATYAEKANLSIHFIVSGGSVALVGGVTSEVERLRVEQDAPLVDSFSPVQNSLLAEGQGATQ